MVDQYLELGENAHPSKKQGSYSGVICAIENWESTKLQDRVQWKGK